MNDQLLLTSIYDAINKISYPTKRYYQKSRILSVAIFKQFIQDKDGINFMKPKELPNKFFKTVIKSGGDLSCVLRELRNAEILLSDGKYSTGTGTTKAYCKSYVLNPSLIYNHKITFTQFPDINKINDKIKFKKMNKNLQLLKVDKNVMKYIPELIEEQLTDLIIGNNIKENFICMKINGEKVYRSKEYWLGQANRKNVALINFKNNYYIENINGFIARKKIELEICYRCAIENIIAGNYYASRNKTNDRLDHNLTSLKSELLKFISLDGEETVEIDINNAQFALLANIPSFDLDANFIENAQNGTLYEYIMGEWGVTRNQAKEYMMIALFGTVKNHSKKLKTLFPNTINSITTYKNENGYESFSVMLQKAESNLMIDGLFNMLMANKIPVIPIHDSMRVKKSDYVRAKQMMIEFFKKKNFKCELKSK